MKRVRVPEEKGKKESLPFNQEGGGNRYLFLATAPGKRGRVMCAFKKKSHYVVFGRGESNPIPLSSFISNNSVITHLMKEKKRLIFDSSGGERSSSSFS